jgi:hypothetical protein
MTSTVAGGKKTFQFVRVVLRVVIHRTIIAAGQLFMFCLVEWLPEDIKATAESEQAGGPIGNTVVSCRP